MADLQWDVWDLTDTNSLPKWLRKKQAPFSSLYPGAYSSSVLMPNTYWPIETNGIPSVWSNNIAFVVPANLTNQTQLAMVKYTIAIDNNYWLYLNHSTNFIDYTNHENVAVWTPLRSFTSMAPGLLHTGTNTLSVVIQDHGDIDYFSMVVTTNTCGQ